MLNLSLKELGPKGKHRGTKGYINKLDKLLSILDKSEPVKISKAIRDIRNENFNNDKILRDIRTL